MGAHRETERHHAVFEEWYANNRATRATSLKVAVPERTLQDWVLWYGWHARANARDSEAARIADAEAIKRRAEMLKRHQQAGELLVRRGIEYHSKEKLARASDATSAIKSGIDIERTAEGLPTDALAILNAENLDALAAIKRRLLGSGEGETPPPDSVEGGAAPEAVAEGGSA